MRTLTIALCGLLLTCGVHVAQDVPETPWVERLDNVMIPMRDGKSLAANVLLPAKRGQYPCILVQTPYNKNFMGREMGGEVGRGSEAAWARFDRENYAYVFVDWRGFFGSRKASQGVNQRTWKRGHDGYDCVEWCAKQDWCNGKIGTWGGSALGKQQFDTAAEQPPSLVCAAPLIAYQGTRYESYFEGHVLLDEHVKSLDKLGFGVGKLARENRRQEQLIWSILRNRGYVPDKINVPCLMVSGWWDNYPTDVIEQFNDLQTKGGKSARTSKLVMGPWSHTALDIAGQGDAKFDKAAGWSTDVTLKFFDYYLRGITDNGYEKIPAVNVFQCGEDRWLGGESWAKLCGKPAAWHLHADGSISPSQPPAGTIEVPLTRQYKYDPKSPSPTLGGSNLPPQTHGPKDVASIAKRKDVLVYETAALEKPLAIRGVVELTVWFTCNRVDTDIHARLCDDAGKQTLLVAETIQRAKYRDGKKAQPLKPGEVYSVTLRFTPHAYTWREGHKLKLIITGGNAPRYEPNSHTGDDAFDKAEALDVEVTLLHDAKHATIIKLPVP
jgi:predicted acyl esterase